MKAKPLNEQEIANLFAEFYCELKKYASVFAYSVDIAEDSAQSSFIKLCKNKPVFDNTECAKHWLKKVARNCLFTFYKKNKRYIFLDPQESPSEIKNLDPVIDLASGFEILASSEDEIKFKTSLANSINKLTKKQKQVIELRYFHDLSYEQIAKKTKSKVTNVGFLLNEAKNNLKKHLLNEAKI
jgi:RNA polymerase sigma factor (sigma-70 family)